MFKKNHFYLLDKRAGTKRFKKKNQNDARIP